MDLSDPEAPVEVRPGLRRRVFFGARLADEDDDLRGVQVVEVQPDSSAASVGLAIGDRILTIAGEPVDAAAACQRVVKRLAPDQPLELELARGPARLHVRGTTRPWPTERFPGSALILDHVGAPGRRQRVFLTHPRSPGPRPAVVLLRGFSCRSCEFPFAPRAPLRLLVAAWARAGYCTFRVEKPGVGDSEGPPCPDNDFSAELAGARAGLEHLRRSPFVDPDRIAVFGHSSGGMVAPLLAAETRVAGVGTLGTSADRFDECASASRRRQFTLARAPLAGLDAMEALQRLLVREGLSLAEALGRRPDLATAAPRLLPGGRLFGRTLTYSRELDAAPIAAAWASLDAEVAIFQAEHDYVCTREEAARIVEIVNTRGCGRARLVDLPGASHLLYTHTSTQAAYDEPEVGSTDCGIVEATLEWLARAFA
ncbi:MAG: alpha/beta fold hydrolase [Myxococcales bacterium]|nr:alpha/beta fold hydrolase [Myxococcales bacterium]